MASKIACEVELEGALSFLKSKGKDIVLKKEQTEAISSLLNGEDVLAILPTGYGKSMIFTVFGIAQRSRTAASVLVISPLKSIIADQIAQLEGICSAGELTPGNVREILDEPPEFIYSSAEQVLEQHFLAALKDPSSKLHNRVSAIVIDESHTVETWTGKRKAKGKSNETAVAFREAYGKLSILRSMCKQDVPLLAVTGTADQSTQKTIAEELSMSKGTVKLFVSPNRTNIFFNVSKVKKQDIMEQLRWLVEELKVKGPQTPQTIIFCCSPNDIAKVVNWLLMKLGNSAFFPSTSQKREHCLLGIHHSLTRENNKGNITKDLKENGVTRVVLATTALSIGVNFPNIRRVIMFGPPRSILDFHQEAGRAGRDNKPSEVTVIYHGQQTTHCDEEIKLFLKGSGCIRVAAYASLDNQISPKEPQHDCCGVCQRECKCDICIASGAPSLTTQNTDDTNGRTRDVSSDDKEVLRDALKELQGKVNSQTITVFRYSHGFSNQLIDDIIENCDKLFTLEDVMKFVPVFSARHAIMILEIVQEIFDDCDEIICEDLHLEKYSIGGPDMEFLLNSEYQDTAEELNLDIL